MNILRRLGRLFVNPRFNLVWCVVFGVFDLVFVVVGLVQRDYGLAVFFCVMLGVMVLLCGYWTRKVREVNGGVLWVPPVKLRREFDAIQHGAYVVWCGNQRTEVGYRSRYQVDPVMKPGHPQWEAAFQAATEEVVQKYRDKVLGRRENRKIRRRAIKEGRGGHRENKESDPGGAAEGAGSESDDISKAAEGSITISGTTPPGTRLYASGGSITIKGSASPSLVKALTGESDPVPEKELEVYTSPVWGYRAWNLLNGTLPSLGSSNSGRQTWKPGTNVAVCQAEGIEIKSGSGQTSLSLAPDRSHVPGESCMCGFYAVRDVFDTYEGIVGSVVGWGKIVDGEKGWRAQYAAVSALLWLPWMESEVARGGNEYEAFAGSAMYDRMQFLAQMYNVPLVTTVSELGMAAQRLAGWMAGEDLLEAT